MKNIAMIGMMVLVMFGLAACGPSDFQVTPSPPPNNCVSLSGGLVSDITGTWKDDGNAGIFSFSTDSKGYGDGSTDPASYPNRETRWSISGNTITFNSGVWYTDNDGQQKFFVYVSDTSYWEIKAASPNALTLQYYDKTYNQCGAPHHSTRQ